MAQSSVQSVERTFRIIEILSHYPQGLTLKDITEKTALNKTTVFRLLDTLIQMKYINKDSLSGRYMLTIRLFQIGSKALDSLDILSVSRPHLERLTLLTDEVTHLVIPDDNKIVYLYKEIPNNNAIMASRVGTYNYMYCTGLGKSILAVLSDEEVVRIWKKSEIIQYTPFTITSLPDMQREIQQIRRQGYAIDNEEHEFGIRCVACAIRDYLGKAIGAISIAGAKARMTDERIHEIAPLVIAAAGKISSVFGGM